MMRTATLAFVLAGAASASAVSAEDLLSDDVRAKLSGEVVWSDASGGMNTRAKADTINGNFAKESGMTVREDYNADTTKFFAAMDAGADVPWSMIEFPTEGDFLRAKAAGYLEKLDPSIVDSSLLEEGAYDEYGVYNSVYGILMNYNSETFEGKEAPTSVADLYDLERFPGKRCFFNYPQFGGVLESALLADGVAREDLYPLDLDRAFAKLDTIKSQIQWWSSGDDAVRLVADGECAMGIAWSGRIYSAVTKDNAPLVPVWDGSLYASAVYAVPKGAPNPDAGNAMIQYWIADVEGQKAYVSQIPYPTSIKALDAAAYGEELAKWLPAGDNLKMAIPESGAYYLENLTEVVDRFNRWVALN